MKIIQKTFFLHFFPFSVSYFSFRRPKPAHALRALWVSITFKVLTFQSFEIYFSSCKFRELLTELSGYHYIEYSIIYPKRTPENLPETATFLRSVGSYYAFKIPCTRRKPALREKFCPSLFGFRVGQVLLHIKAKRSHLSHFRLSK